MELNKNNKGNNMITRLTKKQEAAFPKYVKKWTDIGLSCHETNDSEVERIVKQIYKLSKLDEPKVVIVDSPQAGIDLGCKWDSDRYVKGWVGWSAWVDFFKTECGVKVENDLESELAQHCLMYWVYSKVCVVVRNPVHIKQDDQHRLHSYSEPAMLFKDGTCICMFHGIKVPVKYVKSTTFTKEEILGEQNVDIRREMIAKIGEAEAEKVLGSVKINKLNTDFGGKYEVVEVDLGRTKARYLKMYNPSLENVVHIEGIPNDCSDVQAAICFRYGLTELKQEDIAAVT